MEWEVTAQLQRFTSDDMELLGSTHYSWLFILTKNNMTLISIVYYCQFMSLHITLIINDLD